MTAVQPLGTTQSGVPISIQAGGKLGHHVHSEYEVPIDARAYDIGPAEQSPAALNPPTTTSALILLGIDDRGRPHASRFDAVDQQAIRSAADAMGFTVLAVKSGAMAELAARLPTGKLFRSGKAFVPFVGQALFDRLVAYLPISARPLKPAASKRKAAESAANDSRAGSDDAAMSGNAYAAVKEGSAKPRSGMFPEGWDKIRVGQIVLATAERDEGWWTAHVREDKGDGVFVLEWEEWEGLGPFIRRREQIALLHPNYDGK